MTLTTESVSLPEAWLHVPLLFAPPGMDAKKEADSVKEKYPTYREGEKRYIIPELEDTYLLLTAASKHFEEQAALAKNWMRRAMGDAQFAVGQDSREVASRRFTPKKGYWVDERVDDSIVKARGR